MINSLPVIKAALSELRNFTNLATSFEVPNLFSGTRSDNSLWTYCAVSRGSPNFPKKGVAIGPGQTAFTLIFFAANSTAAIPIREFRAALLAK